VENGKTYAGVLSLKMEDRIIPLKGRYLPKPGDVVVGVVSDERFNGYVVEINSPYPGQLSTRDTREEFKTGEVLLIRVAMVDEVHEAVLVEPRKLQGGEVIEIESVKVPRVIGKNGSMLQLLQEETGCEIFVGKNGRVYLSGGNTPLATLAILKIAREAHTTGLTERIQAFLAEGKGRAG
jgi:exosome complex component RRP4